jgi:putative restriction endonuclease
VRWRELRAQIKPKDHMELLSTFLPAQAQAEWEEDLARQVEQDTQIPVTEKRQVILARRGQGKFRERVSMIERACRITQVNRSEHLRASHCKP